MSGVRDNGQDDLQAYLAELAKIAGLMDGVLGTVVFDPHDPISIEAAIRQAESLIDQGTSASWDDLAAGAVERRRGWLRLSR